MFAVIFEVQPDPDQWETYLAHARILRPELEQIDGFVDNIRYRSLTRDGWILSLSGWRDEKALIRWRTRANHHDMQQKGRGGVLLDYDLRVGEVAQDSHLPPGQSLRAQRLDETEVGAGTAVTLITATRAPAWVAASDPQAVAAALGFPPDGSGAVRWDVFDAMLFPGQVVVLATWRDRPAAEAFEAAVALPDGARLRRIRVIREYGMFDRREAPQYYPAVTRVRSGA